MIKRHSDNPLVVGFGIQNPDQVNAVARLADGVVVGSAIVNTIKDNLEDEGKMLERIESLVTGLVRGTQL